MRTPLSIGTLFLSFLLLIMTGCLSGKSPSSGGSGNGGSGGSGGSGGKGNASLQSITLQPLAPAVAPGDTKQFKALGHFSDGTQKDITSTSTWSSSDTSIATVNATSGLATAVASGSATITAANTGLKGSTSLNVATLSSVGISPTDPSLAPPDPPLHFSAKANYSNGEGKDVTSQATWSSSDTTVATIDTTGTATALATGTTTITATFGGQNGTTTLTVPKLTSVSVTPIGPAIHPPGTAPDTQQFNAQAAFDDKKPPRDVTSLASWTSTDQPVATIDSTGLATSVATGQTEISATYKTLTGKTALDVTSNTFSNADLNGDYVISLTGVDSAGAYFLVGTIHANGSGGISGTVDSNTAAGVKLAQAVLGDYTVFPDGRADLHIAGSVSGASSSHFVRIVLTGTDPSHLTPATGAQVIEFDTTTVSAGKIEKETGTFNLASLTGTYAFGQGGHDAGGTTTGAPHAAVGTFTSDGAGNITGGQIDFNDNGGGATNAAFSASIYSQPDSTLDRYLVALTTPAGTSNYVFYLVSSSKAYYMSTDASPSPVQGGLAELQVPLPALANGSYVFLTDHSGTAGEFHIAGQVSVTGDGTTGTITGGEEDEVPPSNKAVTIKGGTYTGNPATGRYILSETTSNSSNPNFIVYVASSGRFFMLRSDTGTDNVAMGAADSQSSTTLAAGTYGLNASALSATSTARADNALLTTDGTANISGIGDRDDPQDLPEIISSLALTKGAFTGPDIFGRGTFTLTEPSTTQMTYIFYVVSSNKVIVIGESPNTDGVMNLQ